MTPRLFLSHKIEALVDRLVEQLDAEPVDPLVSRTILIPNGQMKQWLVLEIAKRKGISMGLKLLQIEQLYPPPLNSLEMFSSIYAELLKCDDPDLNTYLEGKQKRLLDLTEQLASLFSLYGQFGTPLFEGKPSGWQQRILHSLFVEGPWRLPVQKEGETCEPVICFGIDFLPPVYWEWLFRAPSLSIYLFSPCAHFWEDLCTDQERKSLRRYWEKRGAPGARCEELEAYLRQAPRNLANWGKLGRETLKTFDRFDLQVEELYPSLDPDSLLKRVQFDFLMFQEPQKIEADDSLQIFLTGSSRLNEIEVLREEILRLNIPYGEISVLAPQIEPYIPLIQFVFAEDIPYRISGFDLAPQSLFRQGLIRLLQLVAGRWDEKEVFSLFETPSFYWKQGWKQEKLARFRNWIFSAGIQWGIDAEQRKEVLTGIFGERIYRDQGSWEHGLDRLLDAIVYFSPLQIDPDELEELIVVLFSLRDLPLKGTKTLASWAESLDFTVQKFLMADPNDEADMAAFHSFRRILFDLRNCNRETEFPFAAIQRLLFRSCPGQIHSSHLHAVRFAPFEEGALLPAKALFLIGMDEESFPRVHSSSSLDLLRGKIPDGAHRDRYFFLQALFSAKEFLRISYGHLSSDEGKPVGPSLLVQELLSGTEIQPVVCRSSSLPPTAKHFPWPKKAVSSLPEGEITVAISDLRQLARHPWRFFLQKVHGMYLDETLDDSFALQKGQLLRAALEEPVEEVLAKEKLPPGLLGEALRFEVKEKTVEWQAQLAEWQCKPFSLFFRENCTIAQLEGSDSVFPPLEICWDRLKVRLVGQVKLATLQGIVCPYDDNLAGLLKSWPEALVVALAFNAPQVWMLKTGKTKNLEDPERDLKLFIEYYLQCLCAPSPLLSDWADPFLRKGFSEFEKKMQRGFSFEDPVAEWVLQRVQLPTAEEIFSDWNPYLKEIFAALIQLYPTRSKSYAAV